MERKYTINELRKLANTSRSELFIRELDCLIKYIEELENKGTIDSTLNYDSVDQYDQIDAE